MALVERKKNHEKRGTPRFPHTCAPRMSASVFLGSKNQREQHIVGSCAGKELDGSTVRAYCSEGVSLQLRLPFCSAVLWVVSVAEKLIPAREKNYLSNARVAEKLPWLLSLLTIAAE